MTTYHGNRSTVGVPVQYQAEVDNDFCLGRCGPGCFGNITDYFNSSYFTVTAECFAHDVCIGEVGSIDPVPVGGNGNACLDEFVNASWGYLNGAPCNSIAKTDMLDWWVFDDMFYLLTKQVDANGLNVLQEMGGKTGTDLVPTGVYSFNSNISKERYLTAMYFGKDSSLVYSFYSGKLDTPTKVNNFLFTADNEHIIKLTGTKANINGTVKDVATGKPLSNVTIQINGEDLDKKTQMSKTDSKGNFVFYSVNPYDFYTVKLSRTGYQSQTGYARPSLTSTPEEFELWPRR
jgi:hypothetical protein